MFVGTGASSGQNPQSRCAGTGSHAIQAALCAGQSLCAEPHLDPYRYVYGESSLCSQWYAAVDSRLRNWALEVRKAGYDPKRVSGFAFGVIVDPLSALERGLGDLHAL